jgi:hypothetical protein
MDSHLIHGSWDIQLIESIDILLIKRAGAWNKEAAVEYAQELEQLIQPLTGRKWCSVGYAVDYGLGVPEMDDIIKKMYQKMVAMGCICQTTVIRSALGAQHLGRMASISSDVYQLKFVQTPEQAIEFIKTLGFDLPIEQFSDFIERPYPEHY